MDDVVPGTTIASVWGNDIRDRTVQRYANPADRDAKNPSPEAGDVAYVQSVGEVQLYTPLTVGGSYWVAITHKPYARYAEPGYSLPVQTTREADRWTIGNPGRLVDPQVQAIVEIASPGSGEARNWCRIDISTNGGSTWTTGEEWETGLPLINATNRRVTLPVFAASGAAIPTGNVVARLMSYAQSGPNNQTIANVQWMATL